MYAFTLTENTGEIVPITLLVQVEELWTASQRRSSIANILSKRFSTLPAWVTDSSISLCTCPKLCNKAKQIDRFSQCHSKSSVYDVRSLFETIAEPCRSVAIQRLINVIEYDFSSVARQECWKDPRVEIFRANSSLFARIRSQCSPFRFHIDAEHYFWLRGLQIILFMAISLNIPHEQIISWMKWGDPISAALIGVTRMNNQDLSLRISLSLQIIHAKSFPCTCSLISTNLYYARDIE